MIIDCIADLHGYLPKLEGGDLLIIAGDITRYDKIPEWHRFYKWLATLDYKKIIYIAGNHDGFLSQSISSQQAKEMNIFEGDERHEYLLDNGINFSHYPILQLQNDEIAFRQDYNIWGSPWTPNYGNWPFMKSRKELATYWESIPLDTEILITHGPAYGILDYSMEGTKTGCKGLLNRIQKLSNLKLHVFGHIHEAYGQVKEHGYIAANCSHVDFMYNPVNQPIRIVL